MKWIMVLCLISFGLGILYSNRMWVDLRSEDRLFFTRRHLGDFGDSSDDCLTNKKLIPDEEVIKEFSKAHEAIQSLDSSVAKLRMELPSNNKTPRKFGNFGNSTGSSTIAGNAATKKKVFMVIGINTAFSGRRRRDSIRETWMPRGKSLFQLEEEKGIVVRFMIGHRLNFSASG